MKQLQLVMARGIKGLVVIASMFVFSVTLASGNDMTTTTNANASNPYAYTDPASTAPSYDSVGRPVDEETSSLILNNQTLGLSGPVTVSGGYSANYGYEVNASFAHMLGLYDAISLLGAYAPQENRIDITWAHAWTERQRTKVSVERLAEQMDFDYDSGSVTEWVPQYSYGAGYQYLFNKNWLKNVEVSGYYAQAQSQDLDTVRFTNDSGTFDNYRHIAGATSEGSEATLNISPWKTGLVGLGLNYDSVKYDTKYEDTDAENSKGFGFTVSLEQLLSKHVKLDLEGSQREVYDDYVAGVSFLTPSNIEVGINGERTLGENGSSSDSRFNVNLAYFFDDKNRYANGYSLDDASQSDLATWASKSLAYMDEVLAAADQQTVRVVESSPAPASTTLNSTDNSPVITLVSGEINRVNIAPYIESATLTESQKHATPTIVGGPADVAFIYDNGTQSLITTVEVPESAVEKESSPLVLIFPADDASNTISSKNSVREALTDRLTFRIAVTTATSTYLNPAFQHNWIAITSHAVSQVFDVYNVNDPSNAIQNSTTMYINPNVSSPIYINSKGGSVVFTSNPNNCYVLAPNDSTHTLAVTSSASASCPTGTAKIEVRATNGVVALPVQTIQFTAQPATSPYVQGGAITTPAMISNQVYSPGYTFPNTGTTNVVSAGAGATFNTDSGATYLKVFDTTSGCVDVTSASNLGLAYNTDKTQVTLQSSAAIPASLSGHALKMYLHVTNNGTDSTTNSYDNGTTSNCGGTPFTSTVEGAPTVKSNIDLGTATVDTSYTYNFTSTGSDPDFTTGSSSLASSSSYTMDVVNSDNTETAVSSAELGLAVNIGATTISMTGIPEAAYAGDRIHVYLNLVNTQNYSANNNSAPATLMIAANSAQAPAVGSGALPNVTVTQPYPGATLTGTTAGTSRTYADVNAVSTTGTYVKVADASGNDVTSLMNVSLSASGEVLSLQSNGGTVDSSLHGAYNVYVHVTNDAQVSASNCSDTACSALTGGTPYTLTVDAAPSTLTGGVAIGPVDVNAAYAYDFVAAGTLTVGSTPLVPASSNVVITLAGDATHTPLTDTGITNTITASDVVLGGAPASKYGNSTLDVTLNLVDEAGFTVTNTQPETLQVTVPSNQASTVGTGALTAANTTQTYAGSTLTGTTSGAGQSYASVNTVSDTGTYVKVANSAGTDVTSQAHVTLTASGQVLTLASDGSAVSDTLASGTYNVYVHVINGVNSVSSNCSDVSCSALTGGTPYTMVVNTPSNLTGGVAIGPVDVGATYAYDFVNAGTLTVGSTPLVPASSSVVITLAGDATHTPLTDTGITSTITASDVVLGGAPASKYGNSTLDVTLNLVDEAGFTVTNTQPETLQVTVSSSQASAVGTGALTAANTTQTYAGSTLTGTTSGAGQSYASVNTVSDTGTYVKVANSAGTDVTSQAHVTLTASGQVLTLASDGSAVSDTLASGTYNVYVHVMNDVNSVSSNCSDISCSALTGGTPYTMVVNTPSALTGGVAIGPVDVGATYAYDFVNAGTLVVGSTPLVPASSSVVITLAGDATHTPLTDTGITSTITASDVVLGGAPASKYGNSTLDVTLNLVDEAGFTVTNTQPETLQVTVPSSQVSVVGTGAMPAVNESAAYTSSTLTGTSSGAGRSYVDVNTVSDTGTYAKVVDTSGHDVTSLMNVNLAANGEVLALQSNGGVVDSSLHGSYNVYVHVMNDANVASSNCADVTCSTFTGGTPYTVFVNTPPAIVPNANITTDANGPATIGTAYSYDFVSKGTLTLGASTAGATNLTTSTLTMTLADGSTPVNPSDLGLTPTYSATDVVLAGTPIAGKSGTYKVFLSVQDASGFTVSNATAPATLTIAATAPTVIPGDLPPVQLGDTYNYTFANTGSGGTSGPVVSAGTNEYFDEDPTSGTTFTVTGATGGSMTSQFHLVYSSSVSSNGNGATNNQHNVVSLVSNSPLTTADTLTVTFHVVNVDSQTVTATPGSITVGSEPAYLYCPSGTSAGVINRTNSQSSSYANTSMTGSVLQTINFSVNSYSGSGVAQLYQAIISNNQLVCRYIIQGDPTVVYEGASTPLTAVAPVSSGSWSNSVCQVDRNATQSTADHSCQVTYTYSG